METKFHLRARALIYHNGKFLLTRMINKGNTFLPGGHIEPGESIATTLKRELKEEIGRDCNVKEYLGVVENGWIQDNVRQFEINHIFHVELIDLDKNPEINSLEDKAEFMWAGLDKFKELNLLPFPLRELIKKWLAGDKTIWWVDYIEEA